jgi:hypothetical protein
MVTNGKDLTYKEDRKGWEDLGLAHEVVVAMREGQCLPKCGVNHTLDTVTPLKGEGPLGTWAFNNVLTQDYLRKATTN